MKYNWPLCADSFTFVDKLKIFKFLLTEKIWTYGKFVRGYEKIWEDNGFAEHVIMVSSGSTANELIALRRKWELEKQGNWPKHNKVIFPVNTWVSSVTPFINIGFEPVFVDVNPVSLCIDSGILKEALGSNENVATVFYTSLLGLHSDFHKCIDICNEHGAKFMLDNCEGTFTKLRNYYPGDGEYPEYLSKYCTSSTSLFYSHFTVSGTEGGLIFTESEEEASWYRMMRSHGMTRGMPDKYKNPDVNPDFDFALLGSNYRSSNLQAYMASLDFYRSKEFSLEKRIDLATTFFRTLKVFFGEKDKLNKDKHYNGVASIENLGGFDLGRSPMLALPIICPNEIVYKRVMDFLKLNGVMTRPIIGGCLLKHTAFKKYGNPDNFPVSMMTHKQGLYIGLNKNVTKKDIINLANDLNSLL